MFKSEEHKLDKLEEELLNIENLLKIWFKFQRRISNGFNKYCLWGQKMHKNQNKNDLIVT